MTHEQGFIQALDQFQCITENMDDLVRRLVAWRENLERDMASTVVGSSVKPAGAIEEQIQNVNASINASIQEWGRKRADQALARSLGEAFHDKLVLLVFGKVNCGKSTFCNFLADRFKACGQPVQRFYIEGMERILTDEPFAEGITETTSRIQGVELGNRLVILDTPGLHSVTLENGELTKRYTDAADAVLWLTNSSAPGQVEELTALSEELGRRKPLMAVITGSDRVERDEIDDRIVDTLLNKSFETRAKQEDDVYKRGGEYLDGKSCKEVLRPPVSISVRYAKECMADASAMQESGLERLYDALALLADEASQYKRGKPLAQARGHVEIEIIPCLEGLIAPDLEKLATEARKSKEALSKRIQAISRTVIRDVMSRVQEPVDRHRETGDVKALIRDLNDLIVRSMSEAMRAETERFAHGVEFSFISLSEDMLGNYEERFTEYQTSSGAAARESCRAGGAAVGAAIGSLIAPGVGTVVGMFLGGMIGGTGGEAFVETKTVREFAYRSDKRLMETLESSLCKTVPVHVEESIKNCLDFLEAVAIHAEAKLGVVLESVQKIKEDFR